MTESLPLFGQLPSAVAAEADGSGIVLTIQEVRQRLSLLESRALALHLLESVASVESKMALVDDSRRVPMQYLLLEVQSLDELEGGNTAQARCWIKDQTRTNALHVAVGWIEHDGWTVLDLVVQQLVSRSDVAPEDVQYYEQALLDDEVFVFEVQQA